jgi:amidohydrolase
MRALVAAVLLLVPRLNPPNTIDRLAAQIDAKVIAWRRDIHQHPELSNHELRTAKLVADHLRALGLEVRTGVAHTGVIGILRGGKPGKVVALRADMDALPVTEEVDLPFASHERAQYNGVDVGVAHACGHDNHTAILMGVAEVLADMRKDLPGTVLFVFQPAEEFGPSAELAGARLMLAEGAFDDPKPDAVFGLHVAPGPLGQIRYHPGAAMSSGDALTIVVHGRQTHGSQPWKGVDPISIAAHIVDGLQTVVARETDLMAGPAVVTLGSIQGGVKSNIIPDSVIMNGTIRMFDSTSRQVIHEHITRTAELIAQSGGGTADVTIIDGYPAVMNDAKLASRMVPLLKREFGESQVVEAPAWTASEDFAYFAQRAPGFFFFLGVTPPEVDWRTAPANHSPKFFADERALVVGVRALAHLAVGYLTTS